MKPRNGVNDKNNVKNITAEMRDLKNKFNEVVRTLKIPNGRKLNLFAKFASAVNKLQLPGLKLEASTPKAKNYDIESSHNPLMPNNGVDIPKAYAVSHHSADEKKIIKYLDKDIDALKNIKILLAEVKKLNPGNSEYNIMINRFNDIIEDIAERARSQTISASIVDMRKNKLVTIIEQEEILKLREKGIGAIAPEPITSTQNMLVQSQAPDSVAPAPADQENDKKHRRLTFITRKSMHDMLLDKSLFNPAQSKLVRNSREKIVARTTAAFRRVNPDISEHEVDMLDLHTVLHHSIQEELIKKTPFTQLVKQFKEVTVLDYYSSLPIQDIFGTKNPNRWRDISKVFNGQYTEKNRVIISRLANPFTLAQQALLTFRNVNIMLVDAAFRVPAGQEVQRSKRVIKNIISFIPTIAIGILDPLARIDLYAKAIYLYGNHLVQKIINKLFPGKPNNAVINDEYIKEEPTANHEISGSDKDMFATLGKPVRASHPVTTSIEVTGTATAGGDENHANAISADKAPTTRNESTYNHSKGKK